MMKILKGKAMDDIKKFQEAKSKKENKKNVEKEWDKLVSMEEQVKRVKESDARSKESRKKEDEWLVYVKARDDQSQIESDQKSAVQIEIRDLLKEILNEISSSK